MTYLDEAARAARGRRGTSGTSGTRALKRTLERAGQDVECVVLIDPSDEQRDEWVPGRYFVKPELKQEEEGNATLADSSEPASAATYSNSDSTGTVRDLLPLPVAESTATPAIGYLPPRLDRRSAAGKMASSPKKK